MDLHIDVINRSIARGRLTARVALHSGEGKLSGQVRLNVPLAKAYVRELNRLAKDLKLTGPITLVKGLTGAVTLGGVNTYSNGTVINAGTDL